MRQYHNPLTGFTATLTSEGGAIYVPRGNYVLQLTGSGGDTEGDLYISGDVTIIGAGAGIGEYEI